LSKIKDSGGILKAARKSDSSQRRDPYRTMSGHLTETLQKRRTHSVVKEKANISEYFVQLPFKMKED
jgi:hypothetical protein